MRAKVRAIVKQEVKSFWSFMKPPKYTTTVYIGEVGSTIWHEEQTGMRPGTKTEYLLTNHTWAVAHAMGRDGVMMDENKVTLEIKI